MNAGKRVATINPKLIGSAKSSTRLIQMSDGSIASTLSQLAVLGLLATIQLKLNGVATSAIKLAAAEMLTLRAVLPRPKCVTTLLKLPPGQLATRIIATSIFGGKSSANVASHVPTGSRMNCGISPQSTALGVCMTRRKSSGLTSSATENTMVAKTKLKISCCVLMRSSSLGRSVKHQSPRKIKGLRLT